jgi:hypothetical protein
VSQTTQHLERNQSAFERDDPSNDNDSLRVLYETADEGECVGICRQLQDANVLYQFDQEVASRNAKMGITWRYRIRVASSLLDHAKQVLGIEDAVIHPAYQIEDDDEEGSGDASLELPDFAPTGNLARDEGKRTNAYLREWFPEDATVSIWRKKPEEDSSGVQLALAENLIHFRALEQDEVVQEIFVQPDDESRGREIVRKIEEGLLPE